MPFYADTRSPAIRYQFNVAAVIGYLEDILEKNLDPEKDDEKKMECFVEWCEQYYDGNGLYDWICYNYDEYSYWDEIDEMFSKEEESEDEESEYEIEIEE